VQRGYTLDAATKALNYDHDANIAPTRLYDRRKMKAEESPTFRLGD